MSHLPVCAVCKQPVAGMAGGTDPASDTAWITLYCHGERERLVVTRADVEDGKPWPPPVAFEDHADKLKGAQP